MAGLPVVRISREIMTSAAPNDVDTVQHFKDMLNGIRRGEEDGVMLPIEYDDSGNPLFEFELLRSGGTRQINTTEIVRRYDQDIAQSVLADFVRLGHDKVGSYALAKEKTNLFVIALETWLRSIADVFNRYAIPRLFRVNGLPEDNMPTLDYSTIIPLELSELVETLEGLARAGMVVFPDPSGELEQEMLARADLPVGHSDGPL